MDYTVKLMETGEELRGKAYVHWKSWQETYSGIVDPGYLQRLTPEKCVEIAASRYSESTLIAKCGERVVGFAAAGPCRSPDGAGTDEGEIYAIYVLEEHQRKGLGCALMRRALAMLPACRVVYVWVLKDNAKAIAFYEKVGFRRDGNEKELTLGTPVKAIRMTMNGPLA